MGRDWEEKRDRRRKGRSKKMNARKLRVKGTFFFFLNGVHTAGKPYSLEAFSVTVYLLFFLFAFWAFT